MNHRHVIVIGGFDSLFSLCLILRVDRVDSGGHLFLSGVLDIEIQRGVNYEPFTIHIDKRAVQDLFEL